jgi:hypothetical protein
MLLDSGMKGKSKLRFEKHHNNKNIRCAVSTTLLTCNVSSTNQWTCFKTVQHISKIAVWRALESQIEWSLGQQCGTFKLYQLKGECLNNCVAWIETVSTIFYNGFLTVGREGNLQSWVCHVDHQAIRLLIFKLQQFSSQLGLQDLNGF